MLLADFSTQLTRLLDATTGVAAEGVIAGHELAQKIRSHPQGQIKIGNVNPLGGLVDQIMESHASVTSECSPLLHAFAAISDKLPWYTRHTSDLPDFENGHINAEIIGPNGLEVRDDVLVGVTFMRPNLTYPDHHHPPEEVYIVLSEGLWRQNDAPWWSPGIGGYVYNPPNILHAMQSVETPLCAIWALNLK
ncbi:dimethylsulfoniopropionate lyase [Rhodospirillales bacterium]|nr:dimethylsulfoniopropionate lyase [Rhodospirillales bacterium]